MGPDQLRRANTHDPRNTVQHNIRRIREFLYEEGPHTLVDISKYMRLSEARVTDLLSNARAEGAVDVMRRGVRIYWLFPEGQELDCPVSEPRRVASR